MQGYFIAGLTTGQLQRINDQDVHCYGLKIDDHNGTVLNADSRDQLITCLQAINATITNEVKSSYDGITCLQLQFADGEQTRLFTKKVVTAHWDDDLSVSSPFKAVAEKILSPHVKKTIVLSAYNSYRGRDIKPKNDENFYVHIWGSPKGLVDAGNELHESVQTAWGKKIGQSWNWHAPAGLGEVIINPDDNSPFAELIGDNLYIHCPLATSQPRMKSGPEVFQIVLEEVVATITQSPEQKAERQARREAEAREKAREKARQTYVKACHGRWSRKVEEVTRSIAHRRSEIATLQQQLVSSIRQQQEDEQKLSWLQDNQDEAKDRYAKEFDKLLDVSKVTQVEASEEVIKVHTTTLFCVNPKSRKRHEIGRFRIEINMSGSKDCVRWFNLDRQVSGYNNDMQAPHIGRSGQACLGTMAEMLPELVANYEFATIAMVAIQFVESVNVYDSAGQHIDNWPVAEEVPNPETQDKENVA